MIQAIQTRFKGFLFRSRLEARWAVAFEAMGLDWTYEPEGFKLPSGVRYLPDFLIKLKHDGNLWIEVKPFGADSPEFKEFMQNMDGRGTILHEIPDPTKGLKGGGFDYYDNDEPYLFERNGWDNFYVFTACVKCRAIGFEFNGRSERIKCGCTKILEWSDKGYNSDDPLILNAFAAARGARFEHDHREVWSA